METLHTPRVPLLLVREAAYAIDFHATALGGSLLVPLAPFARLAAGGPETGDAAQAENASIVPNASGSGQAASGPPGARSKPPGGPAPAGRIHLLVGPVGAGKSTFARALADKHSAVRMTLDAWMTTLFRADRPTEGVMEWYVERTARCIEQIWMLTRQLIEVGTDAILEIGLITRDERERLYARVEEAGYALTIYALEAARDVRRARVERRNREQGATFSMRVPPAIFELASDRFEPLEDDECEGRDVRFVRTDSA